MLAGCGQSPSPSPATEPGPAFSCLEVVANPAPGPCRDFAAAALARLPKGGPRPIYVEVTIAEQDAAGNFGRAATAVVEVENAEPVAFHLVRLPAGGMQIEPTDSFRFAREPASARISQQVVPFDVGHCGIWSGIDVDGAFWDPVGLVPILHPDLMNGGPASFTLQSATTATLRTQHGVVLQLVRHPGAKHLPGCD